MSVDAGISQEGTEVPQESVAPPEGTPPPDNSGGNPAWAPIMEALPDDAIRSLVKPHLEEWDKGVQQRFTKLSEEYKPYQQFKEKNIAPERLERAYTLAEQIDRDPVDFYNRMQAYLTQNGLLTPQQAAEQVAADKADEAENEGQEEDPRFTALQQQQQEFMERIEAERQATYQAQMERQAAEQVATELQEIEQKHGKLSEEDKHELAQRAYLMTIQAEQNGQQPPTLAQAWDSLQNLYSRVRQSPRPAPTVVPSGGGLPAPQPQKRVEDMTSAERAEYAMQFAPRD